MELHRTDEERLESLKRWWSEHGRALIGGVVIGLAGISGWTFWQNYDEGQAEAASALFQAASEAAAAGDHAAVREAGSALLADHAGREYAAAASLLLAGSEIMEGRPDAARTHLDWVVKHAELPELRQVARLRLAETTFADRRSERSAVPARGDAGRDPSGPRATSCGETSTSRAERRRRRARHGSGPPRDTPIRPRAGSGLP